MLSPQLSYFCIYYKNMISVKMFVHVQVLFTFFSVVFHVSKHVYINKHFKRFKMHIN